MKSGEDGTFMADLEVHGHKIIEDHRKNGTSWRRRRGKEAKDWSCKGSRSEISQSASSVAF